MGVEGWMGAECWVRWDGSRKLRVMEGGVGPDASFAKLANALIAFVGVVGGGAREGGGVGAWRC